MIEGTVYDPQSMRFPVRTISKAYSFVFVLNTSSRHVELGKDSGSQDALVQAESSLENADPPRKEWSLLLFLFYRQLPSLV